MRNQKVKYLLTGIIAAISLFVLTGCVGSGTAAQVPIQGWTGIMDIFVYPVAGLMYFFGGVIGIHNYGIVIVIATIIVRTLAWPIYAKTNDMSLKMQLMQPDQAKIEAKYANKTDPDSQQKKQMEMMQLYKKYGVGFGGCLMPLIQMPIFMGFYQALQRIPVTRGSQFSMNFGYLKGNFLGIDLFSGRLDATGAIISETQNWGIIILAALVGITQLLSQFLASKRQKSAKEESQSTLPAYRQPQQTDVQKQTNMTMKIMMYGMSLMMVVFVYQSTAALGLYWLIGNAYSTLQGEISSRKSKGRMENIKSKMN
jgi:YidC/Oxa1 family membrane protein insertase